LKSRAKVSQSYFSGPRRREWRFPHCFPITVERGSANTNEDRFVVAFNIMIRARIENPTANLELI